MISTGSTSNYFFHDCDGYRFYCVHDYPDEVLEHRHHAVQITLPLIGACSTVYTHSATGRSNAYRLETGQICIFAPYQPHAIQWHQPADLILFYLEPQFLQQTVGDAIAFDSSAITGERAINDAIIYNICDRFQQEIQQSKNLDIFYLDTLSNLLIIHLIKSYSSKSLAESALHGGLSKRKLKRVIDYIQSHLDHEIRLDDLAKQLNLSRYHFSRLFKASIGLSPYQYLIRKRVELAQGLLKNRDLSIADIAYRCGFSSQSHLTRHFKQQTGTTPNRYRCQ